MKERPITFTAPEVRAILEGRKTQTRRVVNPQPLKGVCACPYCASGFAHLDTTAMPDGKHGCSCQEIRKTYGTEGDRLWVRETHAQALIADGKASILGFRATAGAMWKETKWRPSIHMPRWASRVTLEITNVRVERLQDISETDAISEGTEGGGAHPDFWVGAFAEAWDANHKSSHAWETNPWVWGITFKRVMP